MIVPSVIGSLVAGLLIAFGLQLLLANLGIATGMTVAKLLPRTKTDRSESPAPSSQRLSRTVGVLGVLAVLLSVNLVVFIACFLAVRLSATSSPTSGAILGGTIWAAYFLIVSWLGARAIAALSNLLQKLVRTGWQGISAGTQTVVSEVVERVAAPAPGIKDAIAGYLLHASRKQLKYQGIQDKLQEIFANPECDLESCHKEAARLSHKDFVKWLQQRDDLSDRKIDKIAGRLESALSVVIEQTESELALEPSQPLAQSLLPADLAEIDLEDLQVELLHWLKKYPLLAPSLVNLIGQVDWSWLSEFVSSRDRDPLSQSTLANPIYFLQDRAASQLHHLKHQALKTFELPYQFTLTTLWLVATMAVSTLISAAIAGTIAANL